MNLPVWDFQGDCVIISGGARGIGAGLVRHFARNGATVFFGDVDTVGARQLCDELKTLPVHFVEVDFAAADAWSPLHVAAKRLGFMPNLVIANVGIGAPALVENSAVETFDRLIDINLRSAWLAARTFGPALKERAGSLLLVGSVMARFGTAGYSIYSATKAALSGLLKSLAVEYGPHGVRVNMIVPGYIINEPPGTFQAKIPVALWNAFHARFGAQIVIDNPPVQPLAFWGESGDIAQAASFLHSSAARYITGIELPVDGGLLCQTPIREGSGNAAWVWTDEMEAWLVGKKEELL